MAASMHAAAKHAAGFRAHRPGTSEASLLLVYHLRPLSDPAQPVAAQEHAGRTEYVCKWNRIAPACCMPVSPRKHLCRVGLLRGANGGEAKEASSGKRALISSCLHRFWHQGSRICFFRNARILKISKRCLCGCVSSASFLSTSDFSLFSSRPKLFRANHT